MMETLRERLAKVQHSTWSHWMKYLFSVCTRNANGSFTIPSDKAERWMRQLSTSYEELSDSEKNSDREQADKILSILE